MSRAKGRTSSGFRLKLHSRADSLSLESLDIRSGKHGQESRAVVRESLDIPKTGRESLDMGRESLDILKLGGESLIIGRESLCPDFRDPCSDFRDQVSVCLDFEGRAASGFRPKFQSRAESLSLESLDTRFGSLDVSRAKGRAASGFRPKLHSRADSLSLESLDIRSGKPGQESRAVVRESLPKPGRESLDMGRESLDTDFRDQC